jgi:hypothetical protein
VRASLLIETRIENQIRLTRLERATPCLEVSARQPILLVLRGTRWSQSSLIQLIREKLSSELCSRAELVLLLLGMAQANEPWTICARE